jgi:hypothetical protein
MEHEETRGYDVNKKNAHYGKKVRTYLLTTNRGHVSEFSLGLTMALPEPTSDPVLSIPSQS